LNAGNVSPNRGPSDHRRYGRTTISQPIDEAKVELEAAQSALDSALRAWDESVSELWRTSLALTQAQKRLTRAHELLRTALDEPEEY
jgi:exonuclease VII small subunit